MYTSHDGETTHLSRHEAAKNTEHRYVAWLTDVLFKLEELIAFSQQNLPKCHRFQMLKGKFFLISFDFTYASAYFSSRCCAGGDLSSTSWNGEYLAMIAYELLRHVRERQVIRHSDSRDHSSKRLKLANLRSFRVSIDDYQLAYQSMVLPGSTKLSRDGACWSRVDPISFPTCICTVSPRKSTLLTNRWRKEAFEELSSMASTSNIVKNGQTMSIDIGLQRFDF